MLTFLRSPGFRAALAAAGALCVLSFALWFRTGDSDFWWHLKAGEVLVKTGRMIETDPFAWTRAGQPYLATHEWLAEILTYAAWSSAGVYGILLLRFVLVAIAACTPVFLLGRTGKSALFLLSAAAVLSMSHAITDRPQLFSFALFSVTASLCLAYRESTHRTRILFLLPLLTLLWVNLHGGAALLGIALFGALMTETFTRALAERRPREVPGVLLPLAACLGAMLLALFCTPDGWHGVTYLFSLYGDRSAEFIREWQPSSAEQFIIRNGFLLVCAAGTLAWGRRSAILCILMLGGMLVLARSAVRHEPFLVLACLTVISFQVPHITLPERLQALLRRPFVVVAAVLLFCTLLLHIAMLQRKNSSRFAEHGGAGAFTPVAGAAEHLRTTGMPERPFNNYNAGGELIFQGIPVFLDGRNLDYGYGYINKAVNAGVDRAVWEELEAEYRFDAAVIAYYPQADQTPIPYADMLDKDGEWQLTYLDDWTAVFREVSSLPRETLEATALREITPRTLVTLDIPEEILGSDLERLELELLRMIDDRPDGIRARLYLAKLYASLQMYGPAQERLDEAMHMRPRDYSVWEQQGLLYLEQERYADAGAALEKAVSYAGSDGAVINYEALATIFEKAGDIKKAGRYRRKSEK